MDEKHTPEEITEDIKKVADVAAISDTTGGKKLIKAITADIVASVGKMSNHGGTMTHQELISECSFIRANLDLVRAITNAKTEKEYLETLLAEALKQ